MVFWFFKKKDDEIEHVHKVMKSSFSTIKKDMDNVSSWISHFKDKHSDHEDSFEKLMRSIKRIEGMFENHLEEYHSDVERSIVHEHVQSFNRSNQSFMNVQLLKNKLTPSQKRVLSLLNKATIPLDYETIANELKLNIVTIRRHVNDVKKVFEIKEMKDVDRGRKVFYIDKKAKMTLKSRK